VHYPRARRYWDDEAADQLAFCRLTGLALLRHLTNPRILGEAALDGGAAWRALETWLALPQITLLNELVGLDELLGEWAAFALEGGPTRNLPPSRRRVAAA